MRLQNLSSSSNVPVPDDISAVDQLWPQLQRLVEPYGLRRRVPLREVDAGEVRREADDLRDPREGDKGAA